MRYKEKRKKMKYEKKLRQRGIDPSTHKPLIEVQEAGVNFVSQKPQNIINEEVVVCELNFVSQEQADCLNALLATIYIVPEE